MKTLILMALICAPLAAADPDFSDFPVERPQRSLFPIERGGHGDPESDHELGDVSLGGSAGLAFTPIGFAVTGEADFWLARFFSVGPLVQTSIGRDFIFSASAGPKVTFDFEDNEFSNFIKPYVQFGLGVAVVAGRRGRGDERRSSIQGGPLINLGMGVDFYIARDVSLGTGLLFNFMPTEPLGETFYWGWKVLEVKYHF